MEDIIDIIGKHIVPIIIFVVGIISSVKKEEKKSKKQDKAKVQKKNDKRENVVRLIIDDKKGFEKLKNKKVFDSSENFIEFIEELGKNNKKSNENIEKIQENQEIQKVSEVQKINEVQKLSNVINAIETKKKTNEDYKQVNDFEYKFSENELANAMILYEILDAPKALK